MALPLIAALATGAPWSSVLSHSVPAVERELHAQDRYAQFVNREAPAFTLAAGGESVSLADYAGRIVVMNFVYARCTDVCPTHSAVMADLQRRVADAGLPGRVQFLTLATDIEDAGATARIVAQYGDRYGLDTNNWRMLHRGAQSADTVLRLAEAYGLKFTVTADGPQVHGVVTHVIDAKGRLRARFHGLRFDPQTLIRYVTELAQEGP